MKKHLIYLLTFLLLGFLPALSVYAQAPEKFYFQAEARDSKGKPIAKALDLSVKITILEGSSSGAVVWEGDHVVTTDNYGLFTLVIGEGTGYTYKFSDIEWANDKHFLNVQVDDKGIWVDMGTTQFLSVPYALVANEAGSAINAVNLTENQTIDGIKTFNSDLVVNSLTIGRGSNSISRNTAIGIQALSSNTTGSDNIAIGYQALWKNTTGVNNTANGNFALNSNTTGQQNTAFGNGSLKLNTTASNNTALGHFALSSNETGAANTAVGVSALGANKDGRGNTATGHLALRSNTTGNGNTVNGSEALSLNTTGLHNTANGYQALWKNITGNNNTANGTYALHLNTGSSNTANGWGALKSNTTGGVNTATGRGALYSNTMGSYNTAIGFFSGFTNEAGNNNVFIGNRAGYYETESNKLFIDNQQRDNETDARTKSLIYGLFDANPENQILTINGKVGIGTITPASKLDVDGVITANSGTSTDWNTAYSWGDHSSEGYLTSFAETDPVYSASQAANITAADITNLDNLSGVNTGDRDLSNVALKSNVLELDNITVFTPDADYEPATKKYVDDNATGATTYSVGLNNDLGGYIFYVTPNGKHGLVATTQNQSSGSTWYDAQNTISNPANHNTAGKKYTDWRLPTKYELNLMYNQKTEIGGFASVYYWSSTESSSSSAWLQNFTNGDQYDFNKIDPPYVRAIRAF